MRCSLAFVLLMCACGPAPADLDAGPAVCSSVPARDVDVLFVVENGGYVQEMQLLVANELDRWLGSLLSGDLDGDGAADIPPVRSVHAGVVTTDMGTGGFVVPTCAEPVRGDDGLLRTEPSPGSGEPGPLPSVHVVDAAGGVERVARELGSALATGNDDGCGLEQPLEAMLKALAPAGPTAWTREGYEPPAFSLGQGHGDGANAGLVREGSVLVVVLVTSEDDLSPRDPGFFDPDSLEYSNDFDARAALDPDTMHPVSRYADGLLSLREDPARLVVLEVAGFPVDAIGESDRVDVEALLAEPLMHGDEPLDEAGRLRVACTGAAGSPVPFGFPGRRLASLAGELERGGAHTLLWSVCERSYAPAFDGLARSIGRALEGTACRDR